MEKKLEKLAENLMSNHEGGGNGTTEKWLLFTHLRAPLKSNSCLLTRGYHWTFILYSPEGTIEQSYLFTHLRVPLKSNTYLLTWGHHWRVTFVYSPEDTLKSDTCLLTRGHQWGVTLVYSPEGTTEEWSSKETRESSNVTQLVHDVEWQELIGGGDVIVFDWIAVLVLSVDDHPAQGTDG